MAENNSLGFDSNEYTSEGEFYRSNSPEQLRLDEKRDQATIGGWFKSFTELPLELMEMMSPADEYVPGALAPDQSSARQRARTELLHGEQYYQSLLDDPETRQAAQVGYWGLGLASDPLIDTGIAIAPHLVKGLSKVAKGERILPKLGEMFADETGSIKGFEKWQKRNEKLGNVVPEGAKDLQAKFIDDVAAFPAHAGGSPLRSNMDYGKSFDLDTTCPRNSNCDDLVSKASAKLERPISSEEKFKAIEYLQTNKVKAPCKYCYVDTPRRAWTDGKIKMSEQYGVDPRVWTDTAYRDAQVAADPALADKMAEISKKSRPMMASTPKEYAEYSGQFLNMKPADIEKYNTRAGFRLNSSTDFKPEHTMDFIQAITDAKSKGLQLHGYTKEPDFVEIFGDSGVKINMSIAAEGGMKNGVPDPSGVKMDDMNGMGWEDAKRLRENHDDAGTVFVATNEGQLQWALNEPWVDYVIPYHASGQKKSQFAAFGGEDFTKIQNPRDKETGKAVQFYRDKHGNNADQAIAYAEKHGISPQFEMYKDHPGYAKLLTDYARFDTPHRMPDPDAINYEKADEVMSKFVDIGDSSDITAKHVEEFAQQLGGSKAEPIPVDLSKQSLSEVFSEARATSLKNAEELGYTTDAYSGSTHDIKAFEGSLANPEGDWGRGTYSSTSIDDVNANYAGEGPDLTGRIDQRSERLADDLSHDDYVRDELLEEHGIGLDEYEADEADVAVRIARKQLTGSAEGGVVYPLKIKTKDYAVIGGQNPTSITAPDFHELAKDDIARADYDDIDDYEEALTDRSYELAGESEEGLHMKVSEAMRDSDIYQEESVMQDIMGELDEEIMEGELSLESIDDAIRRHVVDAYDDNGEMLSSGEISSQVIKNLGFDGVVDMKVNQKFGTGRKYGQAMEGMDADTAHVITFPGKESTIRSRHAKFDPANIRSKDLLATAAGASVALSAANSGEPQPVDMSKTTLRELLRK